MSGISFLTDESGKRIAVQIDLRRHRSLWEDFYDGLVSERRRNEEVASLGEVKAQLIRGGRLREPL